MFSEMVQKRFLFFSNLHGLVSLYAKKYLLNLSRTSWQRAREAAMSCIFTIHKMVNTERLHLMLRRAESLFVYDIKYTYVRCVGNVVTATVLTGA